MVARKLYSQAEIWSIIKQIEPDNFILANAIKMVYFAGFHKNEIGGIRIRDVRQNNRVLSQIVSFLKKTKKAYTSMPIILDTWSRTILDEHIKRLDREGYPIDDEAPLFPDPRTKETYNVKTLQRHFNKKFEGISFDDLRKSGIEREQKRLEAKYGDTEQSRDKLSKYARHSRLSTTEQLITGKVQRAGTRRKKDLPWEIIVKMIERLPYLKKTPTNIYVSAIRKIINDRVKEEAIKRSLNTMLIYYTRQLSVK